jgi:hypothetical protein
VLIEFLAPEVRPLTRLGKEPIAEDELLPRFYLWHPTALIGIMKNRAQV